MKPMLAWPVNSSYNDAFEFDAPEERYAKEQKMIMKKCIIVVVKE